MKMDFLTNWFEALNLPEQIFACIAVVFTVLLIFQFILLLIGAASHAGHDFGGHGDVAHDIGHDFGHGDFGGVHGDVAGGAVHDGTSAFGADGSDGGIEVTHDGSYEYSHDMEAGSGHVGAIAHDFADVQGGVVVDVHTGDIYLADAAPHDLMVHGPDVGIPDQDLPDGRRSNPISRRTGCTVPDSAW